MRCKECGAEYAQLACERCLQERTRTHLLKRAKTYLPAVLSGQMEVTTVRLKRSEPSHVQIFGEATRTFCWQHFEQFYRRSRERYDELSKQHHCRECVDVLRGLVAAQKQEQRSR